MSLRPTESAVLRHLLTEIDQAWAHDDRGLVESLLAEAEALAADDPNVLVVRAHCLLEDGDLPAARIRLERSLATTPDNSDAHHLLARVCEAAGDLNARTTHDITTWHLDTAADGRHRLGQREDLDAIEVRAREVLASLPEALRVRVASVPIVLEPRPPLELVREGFDPRALGLFEGPDDYGRRTLAEFAGSAAVGPTRIVLFFANLIASCGDDNELLEEVGITVLHELGHYFGLDEDGVAALGLT